VSKRPKPATPAGEDADRAEFAAHAARVLDAYRRRFDAGEAEALLEALDWLLMFEAPAPDWVRWHFTRRLGAFRRLEARTLDEAFQIERAKDPRIVRKERAHARLVGPVTLRLVELHRAGHPLSEGSKGDAYQQTASEFKISVHDVKACWRRGKALLNLHLPRKRPKARS
jgi:hypothetical protein